MAADKTYYLLKEFLNENSRTFGLDYGIVDMRKMFRLLHHDRRELDSILSLQELKRLEQFAMPKKKLQWLAGRYVVKTGLIKKMAIRERFPDLNRIDVLSLANFAPYLVQYPELSISITHSFPYCIGVISERAIGIDLEKVIELSGSLINQYFHPNEIKSLMEKAGMDDYHAQAIAYWTRKEAVSKLLKLGLKLDFKQIDTAQDSLICNENHPFRIRLKSGQLDHFCLSLAIEEESE